MPNSSDYPHRVRNPDSITLGQRIRDRLSGLEGVAIARVEYLTGCTQYAVLPDRKADDNDVPSCIYLDWQRFEIVGPSEFEDILVAGEAENQAGTERPRHGCIAPPSASNGRRV